MADMMSIAKKAVSEIAYMKELVSDPELTLKKEGITVTDEMRKIFNALNPQEMEKVIRAFAEGKEGAAY